MESRLTSGLRGGWRGRGDCKKKKRGFMDTDNGVVIVGEAVAQRWKKV